MVELSRYTKSKTLFDRASQSIPGGVNSPVRAFKSVGGNPVFLTSASGAYLYDADGNRYIDYLNSWGPMILGHGDPDVVQAVQQQVATAMTFGAPTELEIQVAELIRTMVPSIDRIRMVNSGTEACMSAIRLARGVTDRSKIIKFAGCYHGHADSFLIKAGSGALTLGHPSSPGVTQGTAKDTLVAEFNSLESVRILVESADGDVAAIIIEPIAGNMGCIPPVPGFLEGLQALCSAHDIVLIFDEVMTGFRVAPGGAQELYGVQADLVTFGKVIGGGMPVGAFAGKKKLFDHLSPDGPVYQAGTLSGNPVAMRSGLATLRKLHENADIYQHNETSSAQLQKGLESIVRTKGIPATINRVGSMLSLHFCKSPVVDYESARAGDNDTFRHFFHGMLKKGIYLPPSPYESWFISLAIGRNEIEQTLTRAEEVLKAL